MEESGMELTVANITRATACGVDEHERIACGVDELEQIDLQCKVGNMIRRCDNQYDLHLRKGMVVMETIEANLCVHPYVKRSTLSWGNMKLNTAGDHESTWNCRFTTLDNTNCTVGLTKHECGRDAKKQQIVHAWIGQFSANANVDVRCRLCDLLLNICNFYSWFGNGVVRHENWRPVAPLSPQLTDKQATLDLAACGAAKSSSPASGSHVQPETQEADSAPLGQAEPPPSDHGDSDVPYLHSEGPVPFGDFPRDAMSTPDSTPPSRQLVASHILDGAPSQFEQPSQSHTPFTAGEDLSVGTQPWRACVYVVTSTFSTPHHVNQPPPMPPLDPPPIVHAEWEPPEPPSHESSGPPVRPVAPQSPFPPPPPLGAAAEAVSAWGHEAAAQALSAWGHEFFEGLESSVSPYLANIGEQNMKPFPEESTLGA